MQLLLLILCHFALGSQAEEQLDLKVDRAALATLTEAVSKYKTLLKDLKKTPRENFDQAIFFPLPFAFLEQ